MKLLTPVLCFTVLATLDLGTQSADFSGVWIMDLSRSEAAAQGSPIGPVTVTIGQSPNEVSIETTRDGKTEAVRYVPVGAKTNDGESTRTFRWDNGKLITNLITHINKQAVTFEEIRTLNPDGTEMTVEVTVVVQHGYQSGGTVAARSAYAGNTSKGKNVFVRNR